MMPTSPSSPRAPPSNPYFPPPVPPSSPDRMGLVSIMASRIFRSLTHIFPMRRAVSIRMITLKDLRPFLTDDMNKILQERKVSKEELNQLFSAEGVQKRGNSGKISNICMKWHLDEKGGRDGIFIRISVHGELYVWIKPTVRPHMDNYLSFSGENKPLALSAKSDDSLTMQRIHWKFDCFFMSDQKVVSDPNESNLLKSCNYDPSKTNDFEGVVEFFGDDDPSILFDNLRDRAFPFEDTLLEDTGECLLENKEHQGLKMDLMSELYLL